ncbi:MAG: imidazolonepropionase, partial [Comamonadaceae bacterium]
MNPFDSNPSADGLWSGLLAGDGTDTAIVVAAGLVRWTGARAALPTEFAALPVHDGGGAIVTPGLVDCHTHLVYGGQRANEFAMRLAGASYEEVAKAG